MSEYNYDKAPTNPHHGGKMTPTDMVRRIEELEDKLSESEALLAKAVGALRFYGGVMPVSFSPGQDGGARARATLAELKHT